MSAFPWMGNKKTYLDSISFPETYNNYYEPFLGSGSILFHLRPSKAVVNDSNRLLIKCFKNIKNKSIFRGLKKLEGQKINNELFCSMKDYLNENRDSDPLVSSYFITLVRYCYANKFIETEDKKFGNTFNNQKNGFCINNNIDVLKDISNYLKKSDIKFENKDYSLILNTCKKNDFVVLDPPYSRSDNTIYGKNIFDTSKLLDAIEYLHKIGCKVLVFNYDDKDFCLRLSGIGFIKHDIKDTKKRSGKYSHIFMTNY